MSGGLLHFTHIQKSIVLPEEVRCILSLKFPEPLCIHPGDFILITGASGSGKTTLLSILGLLDLTEVYDTEEDAVALIKKSA